MIKISAIIIAKDEENNIKRCLESLSSTIDEIIVLIDNNSKDKTEEIVHSFNVIYELVEWKGYAATKQYAVEKTSNDWILWIDADESLTEELKNEILVFKESSSEHNAYKIARRAFFLGKWIKYSGWYPGYVTRLFNKQFCKFSDNEVHEHLIINGTVGKLNNDIEHYTDPDIEHYYNKFNRYTSLAANELFNKNKKTGLTDLLFRPLFIFIKMYIFKRGFLDGMHGFILALFSSNYVFTKYCKLLEMEEKNKL